MICKHLTKRSYQRKAYIYCRSKKKIITFDSCKKCLKFEPRNNKPIKKKSNKLAKIEKDRDKGISKTGYCEYCGKWSAYLDSHEVYGGSNRLRSIKYSFVKRICRQCHQDENKILEMRKEVQREFEETHTRQDFIDIIGQSYLKEGG